MYCWRSVPLPCGQYMAIFFLHSVIWSTKQVQMIIYRHKMMTRIAVVQIARFTQRWHYRLSHGRWQSERYWGSWETGKFQEEGLLGSFVLILIQYLSNSTNIHKYQDGNAVSRRRGTLTNMRGLLQIEWFYKLPSHLYIAMNLDQSQSRSVWYNFFHVTVNATILSQTNDIAM